MKLCRVRGDRDGEGKAELILIGIWKEPSTCSRPAGWQANEGLQIGYSFFFPTKLQVGQGKGKWQAKHTIICYESYKGHVFQITKDHPFRHTTWEKNLSETNLSWLFKHGSTVAKWEELSALEQEMRGLIVCAEFECYSYAFYYYNGQALLNNSGGRNVPSICDGSLPSPVPRGGSVQQNEHNSIFYWRFWVFIENFNSSIKFVFFEAI